MHWHLSILCRLVGAVVLASHRPLMFVSVGMTPNQLAQFESQLNTPN